MEDDVLKTPAEPDRRAPGPAGAAPSDPEIAQGWQGPSTGICLSCGDDLSEPLRRSASLRCHDCRDSGAPLNRDLVEPGGQLLPPERRRRLFRRAA